MTARLVEMPRSAAPVRRSARRVSSRSCAAVLARLVHEAMAPDWVIDPAARRVAEAAGHDLWLLQRTSAAVRRGAAHRRSRLQARVIATLTLAVALVENEALPAAAVQPVRRRSCPHSTSRSERFST